MLRFGQSAYLVLSLLVVACGERVAITSGVSAVVREPWSVEQYTDVPKGYVLKTQENSSGAVYQGIATIRVETTANHTAALNRLVAIARERVEPVQISNDRGWPSVSRRFRAPLDRDAAERLGSNTSLWVALTWASAVAERVIRVECRVPIGSETDLQRLDNLSRSIEAGVSSPVGQTARDIDELSKRVAAQRAVMP